MEKESKVWVIATRAKEAMSLNRRVHPSMETWNIQVKRNVRSVSRLTNHGATKWPAGIVRDALYESLAEAVGRMVMKGCHDHQDKLTFPSWICGGIQDTPDKRVLSRIHVSCGLQRNEDGATWCNPARCIICVL